jgi:hypothetical protein
MHRAARNRWFAASPLEGRDIELSVSPKDIRTSPYDLLISARTARIDDNLGRGTDGSNPLPSREESANHRFLSPHARDRRRRGQGAVRIVEVEGLAIRSIISVTATPWSLSRW